MYLIPTSSTPRTTTNPQTNSSTQLNPSTSLHISPTPCQTPIHTINNTNSPPTPTSNTSSPTTILKPTNSLANPPLSLKMTTRAEHGIFRPHQLFNLHTSNSPIISHLPINPINALQYHSWKMAMKDEYDVLIENKTWELVPSLTKANVI